jgi:hypothetical protein
MPNIGILQFNCGLANHSASRPIFDGVAPANHQLLIIQEPQFRTRNSGTYCPPGYTLIMEPSPTVKICFMISKAICPSQWSSKFHSCWVAEINMRINGENLRVINVYNPRDVGPRIKTWDTIRTATEGYEGHLILAGDFNCHHPVWGGRATATEPQAEHLLTETRRRGLEIATPEGIPTWRRNQMHSVIDLTFTSPGITARTLRCRPRDDWAVAQDHIPIDISIALAPPKQPPSKRYALQRAEWDKITLRIRHTEWETAEEPIAALQDTIRQALEDYCPKARPSIRANPHWSPEASEFLAGTRRARRRAHATGEEQDRVAYKSYKNLLKKELARVSRANWRRFVEESTATTDNSPHNKGLWRLSKWSRQTAGKTQAPPQLPPLRRQTGQPLMSEDAEKAQILAEAFYPGPAQADLSDIATEEHEEPTLNINAEVTTKQVETAMNSLPNGKAPGPDGITNEALTTACAGIKPALAKAISNVFASGQLPKSMRESTTVVLRKAQKEDYTIPQSFRPIALENTIAKLMEKIVAERMANASEEHNLLPWVQMGARRKRSTLSALELLTTCVQTAWKARPGCVASMLCLDISGAFDKVSHERLLWVLRKKGFPPWITTFVKAFLSDRRSKITFSGYTSEWIPANTGIPQGSTLSPILFLFYISELLEDLMRPNSDTVAMGFVDDTNIITWGASAQENCIRLEQAHDRCIAWAKRYGAIFAPRKYHLIHFTKRRRDNSGDLASTMRFEGGAVQPETVVRVLGVQVDAKLNWAQQIQQAARNGDAAFKAMSGITASTWGPSMRRSRLIYSAVVKPTMLYGSQIWGVRDNGEPAAASKLKPLAIVQNRCLRRILGAYKRSPTAALEREAATPPIDLHIDTGALQFATKTATTAVVQDIKGLADTIWNRMRRAEPSQGQRRPSRRRPDRSRPKSAIESTRMRALLKEDEVRDYLQHQAERERTNPGRHREQGTRRRNAGLEQGGHSHQWKPATLIARWADLEWKHRWKSKGSHSQAATWHTPWSQQVLRLYEGLSKHEATALFLLRTEVIGLKAWLASVRVPGIHPRCECGIGAQTVRHILLHCTRLSGVRPAILGLANNDQLAAILSTNAGARAASRMLLSSGLIQYFQLAENIATENTQIYQPPPQLDKDIIIGP